MYVYMGVDPNELKCKSESFFPGGEMLLMQASCVHRHAWLSIILSRGRYRQIASTIAKL